MKRLLAYLFIVLGLGLIMNTSIYSITLADGKWKVVYKNYPNGAKYSAYSTKKNFADANAYQKCQLRGATNQGGVAYKQPEICLIFEITDPKGKITNLWEESVTKFTKTQIAKAEPSQKQEVSDINDPNIYVVKVEGYFSGENYTGSGGHIVFYGFDTDKNKAINNVKKKCFEVAYDKEDCGFRSYKYLNNFYSSYDELWNSYVPSWSRKLWKQALKDLKKEYKKDKTNVVAYDSGVVLIDIDNIKLAKAEPSQTQEVVGSELREALLNSKLKLKFHSNNKAIADSYHEIKFKTDGTATWFGETVSYDLIWDVIDNKTFSLYNPKTESTSFNNIGFDYKNRLTLTRTSNGKSWDLEILSPRKLISVAKKEPTVTPKKKVEVAKVEEPINNLITLNKCYEIDSYPKRRI